MSSKPPEPLDLENDLPTTPEDVAALRRVREARRMPFAEFLRWLSRSAPAGSGSRARKTHRGHEPFEL